MCLTRARAYDTYDPRSGCTRVYVSNIALPGCNLGLGRSRARPRAMHFARRSFSQPILFHGRHRCARLYSSPLASPRCAHFSPRVHAHGRRRRFIRGFYRGFLSSKDKFFHVSRNDRETFATCARWRNPIRRSAAESGARVSSHARIN